MSDGNRNDPIFAVCLVVSRITFHLLLRLSDPCISRKRERDYTPVFGQEADCA